MKLTKIELPYEVVAGFAKLSKAIGNPTEVESEHEHVETEILERAATRIADLENEVQRLQVALAFWLPHVPAEGPEEILNRVGDDSMLLCGLQGDPPPSAEERGWIKLSTAS